MFKIFGFYKFIKINNLKKLKDFSHLFENNKNKQMLFYHRFLTNDVILINDEKSKYTIPFLIHFTSSTVDVKQENEKLIFEIIEPSDWSFAKMTITNQNSGKTETVTVTPDKTIIYDLMENGEYFIESKIRFNENSTTTFNVINVNGISDKKSEFEIISRELLLIIVGISIIGIVGIIKRN